MSIDRAKYIRNWTKQRYQKRKSEGICIRCGKVPARAGKVMCEECAQEDTARTMRRYAVNPWHKKRTGNLKKLLKAVAESPVEFAAAMSRHYEGGCIMDMFGCSERCEKYQNLTCDDCIRDWLNEEDTTNDKS